MDDDNVALLTKSSSAVAAKRRARRGQIREIVFDDEARRAFLTGFHKRKVARREEAKKKAQFRDKRERLETRRERRRALAERAARNAAEVERACGAFADGDGDEWEGVSRVPERMEEEYEGEEQLATVTVVQDFDLSALLHGPPPATDVKRTAKDEYERRKQPARRTGKAERAR